MCLSPHLDLGQSSGCWTKEELGVGGGLSLSPKSCCSAICVRVAADVPEMETVTTNEAASSSILHRVMLRSAKKNKKQNSTKIILNLFLFIMKINAVQLHVLFKKNVNYVSFK